MKDFYQDFGPNFLNRHLIQCFYYLNILTVSGILVAMPNCKSQCHMITCLDMFMHKWWSKKFTLRWYVLVLEVQCDVLIISSKAQVFSVYYLWLWPVSNIPQKHPSLDNVNCQFYHSILYKNKVGFTETIYSFLENPRCIHLK